MILRPDQIEKYYTGELGYGSKKNRDELWPNGVVPYIISGELCKLTNCEARQVMMQTSETFKVRDFRICEEAQMQVQYFIKVYGNDNVLYTA